MSIEDIVTGINHCVREADKISRAIEDSDYITEEAKSVYTLSHIQPGTNKKLYDYDIKDYSPLVFADIRKNFGAPPDVFLQSWTVPKDAELKQSTARSGSMFYTTPDKRYMFKTILHPEVAAMMDLLKDYHEHTKKHKSTFLVKIYGLFRVSYTNKIWVLIMGNTFPPQVKMDQIFDLKGRKPKPGKDRRGDEVIGRAFKDNEISRCLYFATPEEKTKYLDQLANDIELLKLHNIMDYSLLVGIHTITDEDRKQANLINLQKGGKKEDKNKSSSSSSSSSKKASSKTNTTSRTPDNKKEGKSKKENVSSDDSNIIKSSPPTKSRSKHIKQDSESNNNGSSTSRKSTKDDQENNGSSTSRKTKRKEDSGSGSLTSRKSKEDSGSSKNTTTSPKSKSDSTSTTSSSSKKEKTAEKKTPKKPARTDSESVSDDLPELPGSPREDVSPSKQKKSKSPDKSPAKDDSEDDSAKEEKLKSSKKSSKKSKKPEQQEEDENSDKVDDVDGQARTKKRSSSTLASTSPKSSKKKKSTDQQQEDAKMEKVSEEEEEKEEEQDDDNDKENDDNESSKKSKKSKKSSKKTTTSNKSIFDMGGLRGINPETGEDELIWIGIIDNLTVYTFAKQVANFCKSFLWDEETLSTVHSELYAQRFSNYMTHNLLHDEKDITESDEEKELQERVEHMKTEGPPVHVGVKGRSVSSASVNSDPPKKKASSESTSSAITSPRYASSPPKTSDKSDGSGSKQSKTKNTEENGESSPASSSSSGKRRTTSVSPQVRASASRNRKERRSTKL
eukprot:TRINITY_DN53_c2_g1_i1.p1 TRINITY_DN53_c2_g1~~TRINITY_DN53_c2_g1_i1.p1  ORF type:complete len:788 (-),score=275.37 TRINITY_DN53_c2_g1_i1:102-2465(-)